MILLSRFPFNWKTPFGYCAAVAFQCAGAVTVFCTHARFLILIIVTAWLFIVFADDITRDMVAFNVSAQTTNENHAKLTRDFCDLIQIYSDAKEYGHGMKCINVAYYIYQH